MSEPNKKPAQVFHFSLQGKREHKYDFLNQNSLSSIAWKELQPTQPNFFFVEKDFAEAESYEKGFKVDEVFIINTSGIKTHDDGNLINVKKFQETNQKYYYRPFDIQNIEYDLKKVVRHRFSVMKHLLKENIAILFPRQAITEKFGFFISKGLTDINYTGTAGQFGAGLVFPLYLYPESKGLIDNPMGHDPLGRIPNLNMEIVNKIAEGLGLKFVAEKDLTGFKNLSGLAENFAPIDILDYIYAVLHSPSYREKYKEFLKIDFPRVPFPKDLTTFQKLSNLGSQIRQIHLLESPVVENYITQYPIDGDNLVVKPRFEAINSPALQGRVYINETQYFDHVPQIAWEFYIGGYQPAQKWLKDRKDRKLEFDDILHYQKIIVALTETDRIMREIDKIEIE